MVRAKVARSGEHDIRRFNRREVSIPQINPHFVN